MHEAGLNARPAALFVQVSSKFNSRIWVKTGSKKVNAKSIMGIMSLGIRLGDEFILIIEGSDEKEAINALTELINSNFTHVPKIEKN